MPDHQEPSRDEIKANLIKIMDKMIGGFNELKIYLKTGDVTNDEFRKISSAIEDIWGQAENTEIGAIFE